MPAESNELLDFSSKVVLIAGGSTGIGRASALAFARQRAKVVIGDLADGGWGRNGRVDHARRG
jgi:NAD(P)-dependent dehydrogenase (short-subunit alcohol dehydrogenase family)